MSAMESVQRLMEENRNLKLDNLKLKEAISSKELDLNERNLIIDQLKLSLKDQKESLELKINDLESDLDKKQEEVSNSFIVIKCLKRELKAIEDSFKPNFNNKRKQSNIDLSPSKRRKTSHNEKGVWHTVKSFFFKT